MTPEEFDRQYGHLSIWGVLTALTHEQVETKADGSPCPLCHESLGGTRVRGIGPHLVLHASCADRVGITRKRLTAAFNETK